MTTTNVESTEDLNSGDSNNTTQNDAESEELESAEITNTDKSEPRNRFSLQTIYAKMYIICKELYFLLLLVFTYAAFLNNTPKVSKSPVAFPFFPLGSVVKDWYRGQLTEAIERVSESDIAFVMYYAPWDAESQAIRHEFDIVAQHMNKHIHFAAINCWHPGSECRQQYNKVYSWPVLMVYPAHSRGIQYRGSRTAEHMIKFLQSVSLPLLRVTSTTDLSIPEAIHDAVVVAYVDAKLGSADYGVYYSASLRFLERDPLREILFAVETGTIKPVTYPVYQFPMLQLRLWNETLIYPHENKWNPEAIINWISDNLHQVSIWASPPGGKSQSLAAYIQPGPALLLFTPRNPLYDTMDYYLLLHDVATEYYNCDNNLRVFVHKTLISLKREENYINHKKIINECKLEDELIHEKFPTVITYDMPKIWLNNTCSVENKFDQSVCSGVSTENVCSRVVKTYPTTIHRSDSKEKKKIKEFVNKNNQVNQYKTSMLTGEQDPRSPINLKRFMASEECRYARIAHKLQKPLFTETVMTALDKNDNISGMACRTNMSLSILALDSLQHHHFAEALGVDVFGKKDKTAVVILNPLMETHHVMNDSYNKFTIRKFIKQFTGGALNRMLSSTEMQRKHTHFYKHSNLCLLNDSKHFCIHELTTASFLPFVMQTDVSVIVFYYSAKCAFCSGVSHTLLTVARTLASMKDINFARIDGDSHALPWEYTMHHYPTILLFPSLRKSESRAFPQNVPITLPNVLSFILTNVEPDVKLRIMWILCKKSRFEHDMLTCSRTIRIEILSIIERSLRDFRSSTNIQQRNAVLRKLMHLKSLHFLFTNPLKYISKIEKHVYKVNYVK